VTRNLHNHDATFETGLALVHGLTRSDHAVEPGRAGQRDLVFRSVKGIVFNLKTTSPV
jgi:hypothetical protein